MPPLPLESELVALAVKAVVIAFGATAALLTWSCLAMSARWSDLEELRPGTGPLRALPTSWRAHSPAPPARPHLVR